MDDKKEGEKMASIQTAIELYDAFSAPMQGIIDAVYLGVGAMADLHSSMNEPMTADVCSEITEQMNQAVAAIEEARAALEEPVSHEHTSLSWQSDGMDVFANSGIDRFQQEVQSANDMLNTLNSTQETIAQQAANTCVFPENMVSDLANMQNRMQEIQSRIQQIENNPLNVGTDIANAELEQLRSQLNQAVQEQSELNQAMQKMDVSAANDAYLRLSQTVGNTERYIRDNVDEQGRFNQAIQEGTNQADDLMNTIKGAVAAYVSIQSIGNVLNISDEIVQTSSRLNMMNDGLQTTDELTKMVFASAQNARGSFQEMADVVARFGNNAGDAFGSSEEVVAFAELIQKQMTIAGASTAEASAAMLQLSQGLGSGVLRGDELNSIFEQAPNLIQNIADYLGVPIGEIREMASEGELTADIVKNAIFAATDEINANFEAMPMTWGQIWQSFQNTALVAFQPVLQRINDLANSDGFQNFVTNAVNALAWVAGVALEIFDLIASVGGFIADNWSVISPFVWAAVAALAAYGAYLAITKGIELASAAAKIVMCVAQYAYAAATGTAVAAMTAQTAAQYGLNTALLACPLTWIILLIIALIAVVIAVANYIANLGGTATTAFGVISGGVNVVIQFFKNLGLMVANIALGIGNAIAAVASNIMTAFHNAICSVQAWWYDLLSTVLTVVEGICEALNKLPFVEFDYSGISQAADDYAAKSAEAAGNKEDYTSIADAFNEGMSTFDTFQDGWVDDAYSAGAAWGDGIQNSISDSITDAFDSSSIEIPNQQDYTAQFNGMNDSLDTIATDTGGISDAMDITQEDLKYMRDAAEQDAVNRFTIAEVKIEQTNNNNVSSDMDLDGVVSGLTDAVNEAVDIMTEGVHE